jgi:hypothetical protein
MVEYEDGFPLWSRALLNFFNVDFGSAPNLLRAWLTGMPLRYLDEDEMNGPSLHPDCERYVLIPW